MIEWDPIASADVLYLATPPLIAPVPNVVLPSLNVTVPVAAMGVNVAVKVTDEPCADGFADEASATLELALFTVCVSVDEVLAVSLVSPP